MLLIVPPVAKPCEPPAGVAKLAGALIANNIPCTVLDGNLEGLLFLLERAPKPSDTWSRRAIKNAAANLSLLRGPEGYRSLDRYRRAVSDLQRVLAVSSGAAGITVGLADYQDRDFSPLRGGDLIGAAEQPERNPFSPWFSERLREIIEHAGAGELVGFSLNFLSQALCAFAMIGFVRREFPGARIVLGGGLVTSWMKRPGWRDPFGGLVDHLIAGPGEGPLLALHGIIGEHRRRAAPDYAQLPIGGYLSPGPILPYSASSGCYWNKCTFCPEPAEDNPYLPVPVDQAVADLEGLIARRRPVMLHLLDNAVSPALMRALGERRTGVPWYGFARIDGALTDLDYCMQLKESGCVMLKLGLESGDQGVLDATRKGIDLVTASRALINLRKAGIAAYVYLLFGTPAETATEARRTLDFVRRHGDAITFLNLAVFNMPLSGTYGRGETGPFYEGDLSLYTGFRHPRGWDRREVRQFLDKEFTRHPAVASILKACPPVFTSNHAAFFSPSWNPYYKN